MAQTVTVESCSRHRRPLASLLVMLSPSVGVVRGQLGFAECHEWGPSQYAALLQNYSRLMIFYGIRRGGSRRERSLSSL